MKNIMFFCIPAYGHHNPTMAVAKELIERGNNVRYYSFSEFRDKIKATGAEFISCDSFLPAVGSDVETGKKTLSTTEMTIVDLEVTMEMNDFLAKEVEEYKPDVIVADSVCF